MSKTAFERIITLTISGKSAKRGHVPIEILAQKLNALQESLYSAANALKSLSSSSRGNWSSQITSSCKLVFRNFRKGSLAVEAELTEKHEEPLSGELDFGLQTLKGFKETSEAIKNNDIDKIQRLMPIPANRERFLGKYKELCPQNKDYEVSIGDYDGRSFARLTVESKAKIEEFKFSDEQETTLTMRGKVSGEFIEIRVGDYKRHFILKTSKGEFRCSFSPEMEHFIQQIPAGSLVEVDCNIVFNEDRDIKQIGDIFDVDVVNLTQPEFKKFKWENKKYILKQPINGTLEFEDGLWIYEVPRYGLHTYSYNRMSAYYALQEDFAFQCDDLLEECDDNLTPAAIRLRDILKNDILRIMTVREDD